MWILDTDSFAQYERTGGMECPYCGSRALYWLPDTDVMTDGTVQQGVGCSDCKKEWLEHYRLSHVEVFEDPRAGDFTLKGVIYG